MRFQREFLSKFENHKMHVAKIKITEYPTFGKVCLSIRQLGKASSEKRVYTVFKKKFNKNKRF